MARDLYLPLSLVNTETMGIISLYNRPDLSKG